MGESPDTEYTPATTQVRYAYVTFNRDSFVASTAEHEHEFDRWLAAHDREVAAKALEDAANWMQLGIGEPWNPDDEELLRKHWSARRKYLYDRAAHIREGDE